MPRPIPRPIPRPPNGTTPAKRNRAIKYHPDKNHDDPNAEERFKSIAIAYQTLSDSQLRHKYNEFGPKESAPEGGFVDPEEIFGTIFGGERFLLLIGQLSLARDMKTVLQEADEADGEQSTPVVRDAKGREILSPEEKAKKEAKEHKVAAEVRLHRNCSDAPAVDLAASCREQRRRRSACRSSLRICGINWESSPRMP
jgi:DnaJ-class molecular chaperone